MVKKVVGGIVVLALAGLVGYLALWPVPIDPAAWTPPVAPALETNSLIAAGRHRCNEMCDASEDVALGDDGTIYLAMRNGEIVTVGDDDEPHRLASTGGHPLGTAFDGPRHRLIVCDPYKGLLSLDLDTNELTTLSTSQGGRDYKFTDDVDIAADGTIYFTDASSKYRQDQYRLEVMEHRPHGRFLAYHPDSGEAGTGETELLVDDLYFANGVALAEDESFALVNETSAYRIRKVWLTGPKKGEVEILVDNLPGFPDGISRGSDGIFWVAFFTPRNAMLDGLLPKPFMRKLVLRLPESLQPQPAPHGLVLGIDADGNIVYNLQDVSPDAFSPVTSVQEYDGQLYLGSLTAPGFVVVQRPSP